MGQNWMLRALAGPEINILSKPDQDRLYRTQFRVSRRSNRMGAELNHTDNFVPSDSGRMPSAAVFPGTIQCPPNGMPYLLMCDAGTTGGYPRIAHIIRADRHALGQFRPGDKLQLKRATPEQAAHALQAKTKLLQNWLGNTFELV